MRILLVGGGSGGPVTPLLAVAEEIKKHHGQVEFLLVGGKNGPEKTMAEKAGITFTSITAGKYRRYGSWKNLLTPFAVLVGIFQSIFILRRFKPNCVFGAGSFIQVPLIWAAWVLRIPVVIHQQDVYPSLANKLCSWVASKITVTFENSLTDFPNAFGVFYHKNQNHKIVLTGNPFREELRKENQTQARAELGLSDELPVLLVTGGGTGASSLNGIVQKSLPELTKVVQVLHQTGTNKLVDKNFTNYHQMEFITDMGKAYAAADIVLCRAGLSTITELSNLGKIGIIVPMPDSHQELNAFLLQQLGAAIVVDQRLLTTQLLVGSIRKLLINGELQKQLRQNIEHIMPRHAADKIADIIIKLSELKS